MNSLVIVLQAQQTFIKEFEARVTRALATAVAPMHSKCKPTGVEP